MNADTTTRVDSASLRPLGLDEASTDRAPDDPATLSAESLRHALRRRWHVVLPLALVIAVVVGMAVSARMPPVYVARTLVHVPSTRPAILYGDLDGRNDSVNFQRTQIAMVKSRFVLERAAQEIATRNLDLVHDQPNLADWLASRITADFVVAPEILQIKLKEASPEDMNVILDVVRDTYVREVLNKDRNDHDAHLKRLTELAASHKSKLADQQRHLDTRAKALGANSADELRQHFEHGRIRIAALNSELNYVRASMRQSELEPAASVPPSPDRIAEMTEQLMAADETAQVRRQEAMALESRLADYRLHLRNFESTSTYKTLTADLAATRDSLAGRRRELQVAAVERLKANASQLRTQEQATRQQAGAAAKQYLTQLESELHRQGEASATLAGELAEFETLQKAATQEQEQVRLIEQRIRALQVEQGAPPRARVLEASTISETPAWHRYVKLAIVPILCALAVVMGLSWLDHRGGRVNSPADLEACRLKVLGAIPAVREHVLESFGTSRHHGQTETRQLSDAFDIAREMIVPYLSKSHGFVLGVTSAMSGEGKTVLAAHLAVRLALTGRRTLLVETDVRTPRLSNLFGIPSHPGVVAVLAGEADVTDATRPGPVPGLDIIPSGGSGSDSLTGRLAGQIPDWLDGMRDRYDVIVLDTAPVRLAPETLMLCRAADGVLLSVLRDVSRIREVLASCDRLASMNAHVMGVVFSGERAS